MNNTEVIKEIIASKYGLKNPTLFDAPRGFVAETHIVQSENKKYFARL